jgi:hypothetical protein
VTLLILRVTCGEKNNKSKQHRRKDKVMFRTYFFALILALTLLVSCTAAEESYKTADFYAANAMDKLVTAPGECFVSTVTLTYAEGSSLEYTYVAGFDANGEKFFVFEDQHGFVEIMEGGRSYGFDSESGQYYMHAYLDDTYDAEMEQFWNSYPLSFYGDTSQDDNYITSIERLGEKLRVIYDFPNVIEGENETKNTLVDFTLHADTLILDKSTTVFVAADGQTVKTSEATYAKTKNYQIDSRFAVLFTGDAMRTVTFVEYPGTAEEVTCVYTLPRNARLYMSIAEGLAIYTDAACTEAFLGATMDENGLFPEEQTLYVAAAEE